VRGRAEPFVARQESLQPGLHASRGAADVDDDDRLGAEIHRVEDAGLQLEVCDRRRPHGGALRVQHGVLARVEREAYADLPRPLAAARELGLAVGDLAVELRHVRVAGVRCQGRCEPVHANVVTVEVPEDRLEVLERPRQVGLRLPSPRIVGREAAVSEHLDGEAEPAYPPS
jgi:hypothetical protein